MNTADPDSLQTIRTSPYNFHDTRWAAYRNADLSSRECGHLTFLAIGPQNTYTEAPNQMPDTAAGPGWRYRFHGWLNVETGEVREGS